jgi:hypothetical protein
MRAVAAHLEDLRPEFLQVIPARLRVDAVDQKKAIAVGERRVAVRSKLLLPSRVNNLDVVLYAVDLDLRARGNARLSLSRPRPPRKRCRALRTLPTCLR